MPAITPKQEAFCLAYVETGNASEAYRRAYNVGDSKPAGIHVNACKLLANAKVALRVESLQAAAAERSQITVEDLLGELEQARMAAMGASTVQAAAATAATMGKAKLLGFLTEKTELTGRAGGPLEAVTLSAQEFRVIATTVARDV